MSGHGSASAPVQIGGDCADFPGTLTRSVLPHAGCALRRQDSSNAHRGRIGRLDLRRSIVPVSCPRSAASPRQTTRLWNPWSPAGHPHTVAFALDHFASAFICQCGIGTLTFCSCRPRFASNHRYGLCWTGRRMSRDNWLPDSAFHVRVIDLQHPASFSCVIHQYRAVCEPGLTMAVMTVTSVAAGSRLNGLTSTTVCSRYGRERLGISTHAADANSLINCFFWLGGGGAPTTCLRAAWSCVRN